MISIIVAISKNNVIGKDNALPWHYKEDLQYFKQVTLNKTVVMGRQTFESIVSRLQKPLPSRHNVVVTKNKEFSYPGVEVIHDLEDYLKSPHEEELFIIGGKSIYAATLDKVDRLYITHIMKEYDGDTHFPEVDYSKFELISKEDQGELSFCVYQRKV